MSTLVAFHAHPDDESIAMGGTLARAVDEGHRVVLVFATRGEVGEVDEGFLEPGESLGDRREAETRTSAELLGVHRVEFLGYRDSGMMGEPTNDRPECFWQADPERAADRLVRILREEDAAVLTIYDDHGGYGHPDHINVHRVGVLAAERVGTPSVYENTMNRDHLAEMMRTAREAGLMDDENPGPDVEGAEATFGSPAAIITTTVDVSTYVEQKQASMRAHASQIGEDSFFLQMPPEQFAQVFGQEWFIRRGVSSDHREDWLAL